MTNEVNIRNDKVLAKRNRLETLRSQLRIERSSFDGHYQDLADVISPRRGKFYTSDVNQGTKRNSKIIDGTATLASRNLAAGMMTGLASPARPWFKLAHPDPELNKLEPVTKWLNDVTDMMRSALLRSNFYKELPNVLKDAGDFGTGCMFMDPDLDVVSRFYSFPVGSYYIANDEKLRVKVFLREFQLTVRQIVEMFGRVQGSDEIVWDNISSAVKNQWDRGHYEHWYDIVHVIKPNEEYNPKKLGARYKKYASIYYEQGQSKQNGQGSISPESAEFDRILQIKGYDYFPVLAPRWEVTGEDIYGTNCPGMMALGDIRQLQYAEKRVAEAMEKQIRPPLVGPTSLRNAKVSILPGDITYLDDQQGGGLRTVYDVNFDINSVEAKSQQIRERIKRYYFEDLFLMLASSDRRQFTATEIVERKEEKLLALGPVLERLNEDLFDPLIDNMFDLMAEQGRLPDPPPELEGQDLKVEYISVMAQAQKLADIGSLERTFQFAGQLAQLDPNVLKKYNFNKFAEIQADLAGAPLGLIRSDEEMQRLEEQEAQAIQEQQQEAAQLQQIEAAKTLSETDTSSGNALGDILEAQAEGDDIL